MKAILIRSDFNQQTLGNLFIVEGTDILFQCKTLELPDLSNQKRISCIPEGIYTVVKHTSPTFGPCFWVQNVPNRDEILWHPANWKSQLLGCIAPGESHIDLNADGLKDVVNSKKTIDKLLKILPNTFQFVIKNMK